MSSSKYLGSLGVEARAELEQRLLTRQSGRCFICDEAIDLLLHKGQLDVDHLDPLAENGLDAENNFALTQRVLQQEQWGGQPPSGQTDQGVRAVAGARQAGRKAGREPRRRPGAARWRGVSSAVADGEQPRRVQLARGRRQRDPHSASTRRQAQRHAVVLRNVSPGILAPRRPHQPTEHWIATAAPCGSVLTDVSGEVWVNNLEAQKAMRLPGGCVLAFGDPSRGNARSFMTFDISHPEVVL